MNRAEGIVKSGGHCCRPESYQECFFWMHYTIESEGFARPTIEVSCCTLFGYASKIASESLVCCNKIYGIDYEGRP